MATAAIPHAPSKCTSLYIFDGEFCLTSKHRFCVIPAASVPLLNVHPCQFLDASFLRRQKTSLLCNTSDIRAAFLNVHPCTFLTASFALRQNIAAVWNHGHPCLFEKGAFEALLNMSSLISNTFLLETGNILVASEDMFT